MKTADNTILITGGGSGIGRELARRLHELGNTIIVAGRRMEALEETIAGRNDMRAVTLDIANPESVSTFVQLVLAEHPMLNVLINNAGIMRREDLTKTGQLQDTEEMICINLLGPMRLANALINHLIARPNAAIINVSSGLAFVPLSGAPTYCATKAALHSYTVSLREQLRGRVEVIELTPPAVQTELIPGWSTREASMPLGTFTDEAIALIRQQPTPREILVEAVKPLRWAERDGRYDDMVEMLNAQ
jgi:uncharacterized oxidoreductase